MKEKDILETIKVVEVLLDSIPSRRRLKQMERWLKKNFPTPYPVTVRVEKFSGENYGECYRLNKNITIRINKLIPRAEQLDSLLHEWAHAMTWPNRRIEKLDRPEHSDEWGLAFARVYSAWFDKGDFLKSTNIKVDDIIFKRLIETEYAG